MYDLGGGLRKPQLDGDLRRIRSGGGHGRMCVYCHDLDRSHAINDETKKKKKMYDLAASKECTWHIQELPYVFRDPGQTVFVLAN